MKRRLLFVVTEDWYFCSHRLALARAARDAGYDVWVATRVDQHEQKILAQGFQLVPLQMERSSLSLRSQWRALRELTRVYREVKPDIVHHVALKPVLLGAMAAQRAKVPAVVNALAGLGFVFASESLQARALRPLIRMWFRRVLNRGNARLILQNPDDVRMFIDNKLITAERIVMIRGSGVDVRHYHVLPEPQGKLTVALVARMLRDKGIVELVEAARLLHSQGRNVRVILAGGLDELNPSCLAEEEIRAWEREGLVEWWGEVEDVRTVWAQAHLAVLPSYREGLPKCLLEAAACGRALLATDVPGCREIVRDETNGLLVPVRASAPLARAMWRLLEDEERRARMAQASRRLVVEEFSQEKVTIETLALYEKLLINS
ncbi:glycosyltransferase family 4 protein [candidate division KSB1 bacterium]|nr:glycosyltransferase family 4 protein [candidate division KSB1 bacterium]